MSGLSPATPWSPGPRHGAEHPGTAEQRWSPKNLPTDALIRQSGFNWGREVGDVFVAVLAVGVSGGCPKVCVSLATKPQLPVPWQRLPLLSLMVFQLCFVLDSREGKKKKKKSFMIKSIT